MLTRIGRLRLKQGQRTNLSETKKNTKNIEGYIQNKIKLIKKKG